jgi:hypothetical protein
MQDRCTFEFAIIRVVPKVEREEFFNVGAISDELDIEALNDYLKAWEMVCAGAPDGGVIGEMELASRFRWLTASRSSIIQSSETHPGLSADPERELEDLFNRYVL